MSTNDLQPDKHLTHPRTNVISDSAKQSQKYKGTKKDKETILAHTEERRILVYGAICLSILGVIAFLVTGQVGVVIAMNAPLLAIIGKDFFSK